MGIVLVILFLAVCGAAGYFLFTGIFDAVAGKPNPPYIDRSVHHHYHDERSVHYHLPDGEERTIRKAHERTIGKSE